VGRLIINNAITVNGTFEAPVPAPDGWWLILDPDSQQASLEGYAGLAAKGPNRQSDPIPSQLLASYARKVGSQAPSRSSTRLFGPRARSAWAVTLSDPRGDRERFGHDAP
jgi:hypothetical protein